jgi:hypothetical protein
VIARLVGVALKLPVIVLTLAVAVILTGLYCYAQLDIEAYPNPVPPLVEVITQPEGWSAEEVERYVTIPLEIGLSGMPGLGGDHAARGVERRRGRALRDHSARDRALGNAGARPYPLAVAVRPFGRQMLFQMGK